MNVKFYGLGQERICGGGDRCITGPGIVEKPDGEYVKRSDFDALCEAIGAGGVTGAGKKKADSLLQELKDLYTFVVNDAKKFPYGPKDQFQFQIKKKIAKAIQHHGGDVRPKGGDLARLAGRFCQNPQFQKWIMKTYGNGLELELEPSAEMAAVLLRSNCGVDSRAMLDHNQQAAYLFHIRIRRPFISWQERGSYEG